VVRRRLSIFRTFIQEDIFLDAHRNTLPGNYLERRDVYVSSSVRWGFYFFDSSSLLGLLQYYYRFFYQQHSGHRRQPGGVIISPC
jgi:hypothetical protein